MSVCVCERERESLRMSWSATKVMHHWEGEDAAVRGYKAPRTSPTITVSPSLTPIFKSDLFTPQASNTCWNLVSESLYLFKIMR